MQHTARFERHAGHIVVSGDLDLASAALLDAEVAAIDGEIPVIDLHGLEFIDSSGIHALLRARRARPDLRIVGVPDHARRVFHLTGTTEYLLGPQQVDG